MQSSEIVNRDMSLYNTINKLGLHTLFENKYKLSTIAVSAIDISSRYIAGDSISMRDCIAHIGLNIAGIALDEFLSQDEALEESYKELVQTTEDLLLLEKFINTVREQINQKLYTPEEIKSVFEFSMYQFEHTLESQFIKPIIANLLFGIYKAFSVSHFNHEKTIQLYNNKASESPLLKHKTVRREHDYFIKIKQLLHEITPPLTSIIGSTSWNKVIYKAIKQSDQIKHPSCEFIFCQIAHDKKISIDNFKKMCSPILQQVLVAKNKKGLCIQEKIIDRLNRKIRTASQSTAESQHTNKNITSTRDSIDSAMDYLSKTISKITDNTREKVKTRSPHSNQHINTSKSDEEIKKYSVHYHHDTIYSEELKKISLLLQHESTQMSVKSISEHLRVNNNHLIKMNEKIRKSLPDGYDYNPWGIQFQIDTHEKGRHSIARVAAFPATDLHSSCTEKIWIISSLYTNH